MVKYKEYDHVTMVKHGHLTMVYHVFEKWHLCQLWLNMVKYREHDHVFEIWHHYQPWSTMAKYEKHDRGWTFFLIWNHSYRPYMVYHDQVWPWLTIVDHGYLTMVTLLTMVKAWFLAVVKKLLRNLECVFNRPPPLLSISWMNDEIHF